MLSRMAPSSPPDMRTLHLLRTPDILSANDSRQTVSYSTVNIAGWESLDQVRNANSSLLRRSVLGAECSKAYPRQGNNPLPCAIPGPLEGNGSKGDLSLRWPSSSDRIHF